MTVIMRFLTDLFRAADPGSDATCRSRAPQRTARACCIPPTVAHQPGCVIPAGGQPLYRLAVTPGDSSRRTIDAASCAARAADPCRPGAGRDTPGRHGAVSCPAVL